MPLLMLPGIGSPGLSLGPLAAGLSGPLRTFAIDNIHDSGRSVETKAVTSADDFTAWLDEVRLRLELGTVNLLGLSYGGWISAQYASRFPQHVRRLVLLAPAGTTAPIPWGFIWRAVLCMVPARRLMVNFLSWTAPELRGTAQGARLFDELVDDALLSTRTFAPRKMVAPLPLSDAQWQQLEVPTLFLAGDREVIFPPHEAVAKLARLAPRVEAVLLPGAGHDFFVARAAEVTTRTLTFVG
jgi:pimeloyl-ACP methyl ester carboxylesterase